MVPIKFRGRAPTDTDIPNWKPWTQKRWDAWQAHSLRLEKIMAWFEKKGRTDWRNALIDKHSKHWGKLKPWLKALSGGKCWFSETKDLFSHYDVEHFRPKKQARAIDSTVRDGYWWLAFDYTNFRLCGSVGNSKKGGWFPLKDGSMCSSYENRCEQSEAIYFLDPIDADDVALIVFDDEGKLVPFPDSSEWDRLRVTETAKRLKLNEHRDLAEERRKIWQKMNGLITEWGRARAFSVTGNNPGAKRDATNYAQQIRDMTDPAESLSAVAKWCVLLKNDPKLDRLIS
jgi:uncharacterized protein (TIGR02646 family)